ncbi:uncharacterized protein LOC110893305 [Helianthus annuus]|uniref:uncharacterized protein LOC110893305 n=1 Tax=Helianthus annuus TaxID=4232 RepID=UPI000B8EE90A|nr:uncharacterized protein LOC110893305 [Helianthus annuus]
MDELVKNHWSKKNRQSWVGGIREMNLALLLKWWWRLKEEPDHLWAKVIKAIHHNSRVVSLIPRKKSQPGVRKAIAGVGEDFKKRSIDIQQSLRCLVGNGEKAMVWIDSWTPQGPLKDAFPLIYSMFANKRITVSQFLTENTGESLWGQSWVRAPVNDEETEEFLRLNQTLQHQPVGQGMDRWIWKDGGDDDFSVKKIRMDLSGSIDVNNRPGNFLWNKMATPKSNYFSWRAIEGKIPTADELIKRGMHSVSALCKVCGRANESTNHIFIHYPYADLI